MRALIIAAYATAAVACQRAKSATEKPAVAEAAVPAVPVSMPAASPPPTDSATLTKSTADSTRPQDTSATDNIIPLFPQATRIPVVRGLTLVSAFHAEDGDRENTVMIGEVSPEGVLYTWKYKDHGGAGDSEENKFERFVSANDLAGAPRLNSLFRRGAGREEAPGYTAMTISRASYNQVRETGQVPYTIKVLPKSQSGLSTLITNLVTLKGTLSMVSPTEGVSVLVNGDRIRLPALHLKGSFDFQEDHREADYWILADSVQPLVLKIDAGARTFQMVRIAFPVDGVPPTQRLESQLEHDCRAELPGIYFAFASAELEPASEPALTGVAELLTSHSDWSLGIEGHTDSIGGAASNQKLSVDRAEAVRAALVGQHAIAAGRLKAAGFGATRPRETNTTIEGRARNRRVELVRSCGNGP